LAIAQHLSSKALSPTGSKREERLAFIIDSVNRGRFISLRDITERFNVNIQTARRDIAILDEQNLVTRVHGGAVPREDSALLNIEERFGIQDMEKRCIAATAASFIHDGDVVFIDGGSTPAYLAPYLLDKHIHVVTNSISLLGELKKGWPNVEVITTGGYFYPKSNVLLGSPAIEAINRMQVDKAFVSAAGVTADGMYNSNVLVVEFERAVISRATETFLLADSSKLGHASLMRVCGLEDIDTLVTVGPVPDFIIEAARTFDCRIEQCQS